MKKLLVCAILTFSFSSCTHRTEINHLNIKNDLDDIINNISQNYVFQNDKEIDIECLSKYYSEKIKHIDSEEETVLFFEYLLDEFYDNHLTLTTNRSSSYRLYAPIYVSISKEKAIISNVWHSQILDLDHELIGAEIQKFNGIDFDQVIEDFPTHCHDKSNHEVREWIANKVIAGRYSEPRILTIKLANETVINLDIDAIDFKQDNGLLSIKIMNDIGVIRINNSLGNDDLVSEFDSALDTLMKTKGLIIDLRNTIFGGDSYEARGIMSRFISEPMPYQKHSYLSTSKNNPDIERSWVEYVSPRANQYDKPVVVIVSRWTGSMGEGLAIGFEGMKRAVVVGSKMRRLAGEVFDFRFGHQNYGYKLSTTKLFHMNGTPREKYIPTINVNQTTNLKDETLNKGMQIVLNFGVPSDSILKRELELLRTQDQTLRLLLPTVIEKFGRDSDEHQHIWSLIAEQDSICEGELLTILENHGWLGKSRVGEQANQAIWLIMQHSKLGSQETYLPLLKASVEQGDSEPWHLAFLNDRILMYQGHDQIYGTQAMWDDDLKKNVIYPIADVENVNELRSQLGLESIEDYAKSNDYIFHQQK